MICNLMKCLVEAGLGCYHKNSRRMHFGILAWKGVLGPGTDAGSGKVWCGYYDGNIKSKRVQENVGFQYQWTTEGVDVPLMHEKRTMHVNCLAKEAWREKDQRIG